MFASRSSYAGHLFSGSLSEMGEPSVDSSDAGDEVHFQYRFLRLHDQAAEAEQILNRTMLPFVDVLERPEVDGLMIVDGEERLFDPVHAFVRDHDYVEEVGVEAEEKTQMDGGEDGKTCDENAMSAC